MNGSVADAGFMDATFVYKVAERHLTDGFSGRHLLSPASNAYLGYPRAF